MNKILLTHFAIASLLLSPLSLQADPSKQSNDTTSQAALVKKIDQLEAKLAAMQNQCTTQNTAQLPYIDVDRIMKESLAMKHIEAKKDEERSKLEKKAEAFENKLRSMQEKIKLAQSDSKVTETELNKMQQNFDEEEAAFHNKLTAFYKHSEKVFNKAEDDVLNTLMEISSSIAKAKNVKSVVNKSIYLICDESLDLTSDVLAALNKRLKTIDVKI